MPRYATQSDMMTNTKKGSNSMTALHTEGMTCQEIHLLTINSI